jgi:formylglycine-generating enzyme required for sulfatase activity
MLKPSEVCHGRGARFAEESDVLPECQLNSPPGSLGRRLLVAIFVPWCLALQLVPARAGILIDNDEGDPGPPSIEAPQLQAEQPAPQRQPVPDDKDVEEESKTINETYGADEGQDAKTVENAEKDDRRIDKYIGLSRETKHSARKYALLVEAGKLAVSRRQTGKAMEVVDRQAESFSIDRHAKRLGLLKEIAKASDSLSIQQMSELCFELKVTVEEAFQANRWRQSEEASNELSKAAAKLRKLAESREHKDGTRRDDAVRYLESAKDTQKRSSRNQKEKAKYDAALDALAKDKNDSKARDEAARYLCFVAQDWEHGIERLAVSGLSQLNEIAKEERALANPDDFVRLYAVAGRWWGAAEESKECDDDAKDAIKRHAATLYARVKGKLPDKVENDLAAKRAGGVQRLEKHRIPIAVGQVFTNSIGMRFRYIPSGNYQMGEPGNNQVGVRITEPFLMGETEVTEGQWDMIMAADDAQPQNGLPNNHNSPKRDVTLADAFRFCGALDQSEKKKNALPQGCSYDLPTEAQWEYACRAGTKTDFSFGGNVGQICQFVVARRCQGVKGPESVGQRQPNAWGLCDMHGNVAEMTKTFFAAQLQGGDDPSGPPGGNSLVLRGGGYDDYTDSLKSYSRGPRSLASKHPETGFRVIVKLAPQGKKK